MPLHPAAAAFLRELAERDAPGWSELPPAESREIFGGFTEPFGEGPDVAVIHELTIDGALRARMYRPRADATLPAVVYFHGGGWVLGSLDTHDVLCRRLALSSDRVVLSVDYRLAPESRYPLALEDCYRALVHLSQQADALQIDRDRISVAGDSAGGNLAAAVALRARDDRGPTIEAQVLIYPVIEPYFESSSYAAFATDHMLTRETMRWFWLQYLGSLDDPVLQNAHYAALMNRPLQGLPPTLLITAEFDVLRSEGEKFAEQLKRAGNDVVAKQFDGMLHGFVHFSGIFEDGRSAIHEIGRYLRSRASLEANP